MTSETSLGHTEEQEIYKFSSKTVALFCTSFEIQPQFVRFKIPQETVIEPVVADTACV